MDTGDTKSGSNSDSGSSSDSDSDSDSDKFKGMSLEELRALLKRAVEEKGSARVQSMPWAVASKQVALLEAKIATLEIEADDMVEN